MASEKAFSSILFPVDFSEMSAAAAPHVRGLTELTGANVTLLHVVPWLSAWYGTSEIRSAIVGDAELRSLEEQQRLALERFRKEHFGALQCHLCIKSGPVAETITDTAWDLNADLIMMPTRGLGHSRRFLIGTTTAKVLHDAGCAVWTTPHLSSLPPFRGYKHILCTVDRDDFPRGCLEEAVRLATCLKTELSFVTAIPSSTSGPGELRQIESLVREFPQAQLQELAAPGHCTVLNETGQVGDVVRRVVERHGVDLVLTNRGHLRHPFGKLRTHSYEIVLESPCPVLSLCICTSFRDDDCVRGNISEEEGAVQSSAAR
jgi:nucleotide-binding universal stress UspA family protein